MERTDQDCAGAESNKRYPVLRPVRHQRRHDGTVCGLLYILLSCRHRCGSA